MGPDQPPGNGARIGRASLLAASPEAGFLVNLPAENHELATWVFDIVLLVWAVIALGEQYVMGYNFQKKPWPVWSFWWAVGCVVIGMAALVVQITVF